MNDTTTSADTSLKFDSATSFTDATATPGADDRHSLQTYVSDLLALIKHIEVPLERQLTNDTATMSVASTLITEIRSVTSAQRTALEGLLASLGGHSATGLKTAWSALLGVGAAAVGSVRSTKVSKDLRDDYTALSLCAISYTMLHATALGLGDRTVASLAKQHLDQIAALIMRISEVIPTLVLHELRDAGVSVATAASQTSTSVTQQAWQTQT